MIFRVGKNVFVEASAVPILLLAATSGCLFSGAGNVSVPKNRFVGTR